MEIFAHRKNQMDFSVLYPDSEKIFPSKMPDYHVVSAGSGGTEIDLKKLTLNPFFMRCKKILLVNDNHSEIAEMEAAIGKLNCDHAMYVAQTGKDGIGMLMGSSSIHNTYSRNSKVQADVIFLKKDLTDMSGFEFLSIMRRYYSLKNIKVYLTTNAGESIPADEAKSLGIAGVIEKPFDFAKEGSPVLAELRLDLAVSNVQNASFALPAFLDLKENFSRILLQFAKAKSAIVTNALGLKVAACAVSVVMVSAAARYQLAEGQPQQEAGPVKVHHVKKPAGNDKTKELAMVETSLSEFSTPVPESRKHSLATPRLKKLQVPDNTTASPISGWQPSIRVVPDTTVN